MSEEHAFIRKVLNDPDDETSRLVYADWMEERGDSRADFLRTEAMLARLAPEDEQFAILNDRLRQLHGALVISHPSWLAVLDKSQIENCSVRFAFQCPKKWDMLRQVYETNLIRFCDSCGKDVHYCHTIDQATAHASEGHCVAISTRIARAEGDIPNGDTEGALVGSLALEDLVVGMVVVEQSPRTKTKPWWRFW